MYFLSNLRVRYTQGLLICGYLKRDGNGIETMLKRDGIEMIAVMVNDD